MSSSHFSRTLLDACYLMLFATLWRNELEEGFYSVFGRTGRSNKKVCVTNWGKWRGGKPGGNEEGERRWGQGWEKCVLKKNAELKGLEEQNQHSCKHSKELTTHSHMRAHTHAHLYTGIQWVLPWHRLVYLPYQNVILGRVCSRNSDSLLHCEAITWSNRARLIAWTGSATSHSLLRSS